MSRVLFLAREVPYPPNAGDRIVTHGFVRALSERGHEVHVLAYARGDDDDGAAAGMRDRCTSVVRVDGTSSPLPPTARKVVRTALGRSDVMEMFYADAFCDAAARRVETLSPDVVVAQHPYMAQFFRDDSVRRAAARADARLVTSAHVVEFAAHRLHRAAADDPKTRAELALEIPRLRREELAAYRASGRVLVLGEEDRERLAERIIRPVARQRVALDADEYRHDPADRPTDGKRLLFFGSYDWFPNEDGARAFVEEAWPRIRAAHPDAEFAVAGRSATDRVRALGDRPGVEFVGEVTDLAAAVRDAAAVVAPLRVGGGVRIKILESMAWGAPVVSTRRGFEGVDATPGEDLLVADDWDGFVAGANRLLSDPDERARLGRNARERIEETYAPETVGAELEANLGLGLDL